MKITLFNCAWTNRGDEAAFRAMAEEIRKLYPDVSFNLVAHGTKIYGQFPYDESFVKICRIRSITRRNLIDVPFLILSRGRFALSKNIRELIRVIEESDIVFHNPGGPSMGDLYMNMQIPSYYKFIITRLLKKPYLFYAPSMGPFNKKLHNVLRRYIYNGAELITTREQLSKDYYEKLGAKKEAIVTADSALQYQFDTEKYEKQFNEYEELKSFISKYDRVIGITIATMTWHHIHGNAETENRIKTAFEEFISYLKERGCGVVFIPQIFENGEGNDMPLMQQFAKENCFVADDSHDCFFQQHLISKLYAVVGLRYHSNVFSAKMKTPFISVSYEQKMKGFTEIAGMTDYLIDLTELSFAVLKEKFELLEENYGEVKNHLEEINPSLRDRAYKTTLLAKEVIDRTCRIATVDDIIKGGKCYACGMCKTVCPAGAVSVEANEKSGFWDVKVNPALCTKCSLCVASCPAAANKTPSRNTLGEHKSIFLCRSTNENVRKMATSGGAVNSVIRYLIESETVDRVITVKENLGAAFDTEIVEINKANAETLLSEPRSFASRYVSVPVMSAIPKSGERTAVAGTPCQIEALSKYDKDGSFFKIGIVCSAATSFNAAKLIKKHLADESYHLYYRGNGWPGYNTLTNGENTVETTHGKSYFEKMYSSRIFTRPSCNRCPSHFAEGADLTFFDFWNGEEMKSEKIGNTVCVIRTDKGNAVFGGALSDGYLETVKELDEETAVKTQGVPLKQKSSRGYSKAYMRMARILNKTGAYRLIPLSYYKYFCRLLAKLQG